jgi:limonene 1,2-monooxygenase
MLMAGKFGLDVIGISAPRGDYTLSDFWRIAEETAAENQQTVNRQGWRLVVNVHLAETREQALANVSARAGSFWRDYFENTMGFPKAIEDDQDLIAAGMTERRAWCIGTPDDLIETINRLDAASGGFGGLLIQEVDWATREQIRHSYELIARYVKPQFQGSLKNLQASQRDAESRAGEVKRLRDGATGAARDRYEASRAR